MMYVFIFHIASRLFFSICSLPLNPKQNYIQIILHYILLADPSFEIIDHQHDLFDPLFPIIIVLRRISEISVSLLFTFSRTCTDSGFPINILSTIRQCLKPPHTKNNNHVAKRILLLIDECVSVWNWMQPRI